MPDGPHDIPAIASGKAMDEDRMLPLPDRQAGRAILMRRARHQRIAAIPMPAEAATMASVSAVG
jgi:hypothetical protein